MKSVLLIITIFFTCITSKSASQQQYYYVEAFKEQEVKLVFKRDSTFIFQDLTGCNQFLFTGKYRKVDDGKLSYFILDSVKFQNVLSSFNSELIFPIKTGDTAWVVNAERVFIHKQPFIATSNNNINLQEIRYKKLKEYYVGLLGEKGFLKVFGNGSKKEAKKRLLECKLPDINIR
jgi:mRNA deadenylase 3'-5' endonuclease subunit Ccr4